MADRIPIVTKTIGTGTDGLKEMAAGETTPIIHGGTGATTPAQALTNLGAAPSAHSHTAADVGLGNVDNTSDANKPISVATQAALNSKADSTHTHTKADITDLGPVVISLDLVDIQVLTQAAYDALTPAATTLYLIDG